MGYPISFFAFGRRGMALRFRAGTKEDPLDELPDPVHEHSGPGPPQADARCWISLTVGGAVYGRGGNPFDQLAAGLFGPAFCPRSARRWARFENLFAGTPVQNLAIGQGAVGQRRERARARCPCVRRRSSGLDKVLLLVEEAGDGIMPTMPIGCRVRSPRGEVEPRPHLGQADPGW